MLAIDLRKILWKSIANVNCLVTFFKVSIFFCVQQKKLIQVWNNIL